MCRILGPRVHWKSLTSKHDLSNPFTATASPNLLNLYPCSIYGMIIGEATKSLNKH